MTEKAWLHIIGIGEDGMDGLSQDATQQLAKAEIIIGGERHHNLVLNETAERLKWPSPFDAMLETIKQNHGKHVVVLATGDPLWLSVGARIARNFSDKDIRFYPQISAFQWAACRMNWSLADTETLTAHSRKAEEIIPHLTHDGRAIVLTQNAETPQKIADLLLQHGLGSSRMTVLAHMGGVKETRLFSTAKDWQQTHGANVPHFHTLAIEFIPDGSYQKIPHGPGLPDHLFLHDGKITKKDMRMITLAKLMPERRALLWDIGVGCGSVAIEWMRMAPDALAIGLDIKTERLEMAAKNAEKLGTPRLQLINTKVPDGLIDLPSPDAIFIGGGLSEDVIATCSDVLKPYGRLVANAVTLESEAILIRAFQIYGGQLTRIAVSTTETIGKFHGLKPLMPVLQWSFIKGTEI